MTPPPSLHAVSEDPPASTTDGPNGNDRGGARLESRVSVLESELKHLATKADVLGLKIWILVGVIGGMITTAFITIAIAKLFLSSGP